MTQLTPIKQYLFSYKSGEKAKTNKGKQLGKQRKRQH